MSPSSASVAWAAGLADLPPCVSHLALLEASQDTRGLSPATTPRATLAPIGHLQQPGLSRAGQARPGRLIRVPSFLSEP